MPMGWRCLMPNECASAGTSACLIAGARLLFRSAAGVAQLVEQRIRNA